MEHNHEHEHSHQHEHEKPRGPIRRFLSKIWTPLLSWFAMTGLISTTTVCPFCGQASCPVGIGQAAGLGLFSTVILWVMTKLGKRGPKATADTQEAAALPHPHGTEKSD